MKALIFKFLVLTPTNIVEKLVFLANNQGSIVSQCLFVVVFPFGELAKWCCAGPRLVAKTILLFSMELYRTII